MNICGKVKLVKSMYSTSLQGIANIRFVCRQEQFHIVRVQVFCGIFLIHKTKSGDVQTWMTKEQQ